jgi:rod shape-determining protein MreC
LLTAVVLSLIVLLLDQRTHWLHPVRFAVGYVTGPVHIVAHVPADIVDWLGDQLQSHGELVAENRSLHQQNLILRQESQQLAVLRAENTRLRELLNSSRRIGASVSIAEIIGISPDPDRQELVINRGSDDKIHVGQVVLDAYGVMGQVSSVGAFSAHVILITDANHAMSVQDNRNGLHGILAGTGQPDMLRLLYVPVSSDIKQGDLLVSTGLEGRFPRGYPVASVMQVQHDSASPFLTILARPEAHIRRASHVLLITENGAAPLTLSAEQDAAGSKSGGKQDE